MTFVISVTGRPCGSVAQWSRVLARYARNPVFESRSGHVLPAVAFGGSMWVRARAANSKVSVPA